MDSYSDTTDQDLRSILKIFLRREQALEDMPDGPKKARLQKDLDVKIYQINSELLRRKEIL